jgi:SMI1/KNR4 family protein SUKH-1
MTPDDFLASIKSKLPPAKAEALAAFESAIGTRLPESYRAFLIRCNGGYCSGNVEIPGNAAIHHVGGLREEDYFSLDFARKMFQWEDMARIPRALLWIMDTPGGDGVCIGIAGDHVGRVYRWVRKDEPDPDTWDGAVETAGNVHLLAESFDEFVAALRPTRRV